MSKADALRNSRGLAFSMGLAILVLWFVSFYLHGNVRPASTVPNHPLEPIVGLAYTLEHPPVPVSETLTTPFAYVFYATTPQYACSVLVNIDRLQNRFNAKHRIIVLVKPNLDTSYLSAFTAHNATVIPFEPPQNPTQDVPYYQGVLLKLVTFRLHHYIPSLKRILVLDADELILQSLDHVFDLPEVDLAAPRAYWLDDEFSSAFLLISLSDRLWERMKSELQAPAIGTFDTDIVNAMFKNTALLLPGDYLTLNSHWETNEIPSWWQGIAPSRDPDWQPSQFSPPGSQASSDSTSMNTAEWEEPEQRKAEMKTAHLQQQEVRERGLRLRRALRDAYGEVKVLHFTALGKPWTWPVDRVIETKPDANPLLAVQFGEWRQAAKAVCPGMGNIEV